MSSQEMFGEAPCGSYDDGAVHPVGTGANLTPNTRSPESQLTAEQAMKRVQISPFDEGKNLRFRLGIWICGGPDCCPFDEIAHVIESN